MGATVKLIRYLFTIILPFIAFIYIAINVINQNTTQIDSFVYQKISALITDRFTDFMILMSYFGSGVFLTTFSLILIVMFYKNEKYSFYTAMIVINLVLSSLINVGFKYLIRRDRPDILQLVDIGGYSFPSGHSMVSMSFFGFFIYLCIINYKTKWKYLIISSLTLLILLIGFSRIYLGVHYFSDVIGGFSLGLLWLGIYSLIVDIRLNKKNKH